MLSPNEGLVPSMEVSLDDLCRMHHYFDQVQNKTETTKDIIRVIEQTILDSLNNLKNFNKDTTSNG